VTTRAASFGGENDFAAVKPRRRSALAGPVARQGQPPGSSDPDSDGANAPNQFAHELLAEFQIKAGITADVGLAGTCAPSATSGQFAVIIDSPLQDYDNAGIRIKPSLCAVCQAADRKSGGRQNPGPGGHPADRVRTTVRDDWSIALHAR